MLINMFNQLPDGMFNQTISFLKLMAILYNNMLLFCNFTVIVKHT